jgi:hypothetical protein
MKATAKALRKISINSYRNSVSFVFFIVVSTSPLKNMPEAGNE